MHANATRQTFRWDDPLLLDTQLSTDERAVRDAAHTYCREQLLPRVQEAFRHEKPRRILCGEIKGGSAQS